MRNIRISGRKPSGFIAIAALASSIVACQQAPQSNHAATVRHGNSMTTVPAVDLEAAIEPFEALTEQAFSASPEQLATLVAKAEASYGKVKPTLTPSQVDKANRYIRVIELKDHHGDRSKIALASVEIFKLLLNAQERAGDPVIGAGLLDYAGFRYAALVQANEIDWGEMSRTTRGAQFEWHKLEPSIANAPLRERFSSALTAMAEAATKRDRVAAKKSANVQLQLVDLLEVEIGKASK